MPRQAELNSGRPRVRVVAGILIDSNDAVLIADRSRASTLSEYWEFPGGKLRDSESADAALRRELAEELGIKVLVTSHFERTDHDYPDVAVAIDFLRVEQWRGEPAGLEGQQIRWVDRASLHEHRLLPADAPVVASLQAMQVTRP